MLLGRYGRLDKDFYNGKNVLITGHTGFKGSWLTSWLIKLGANVTGYALNPPTNPSMFELCEVDKRIRSIIGDVRDRESLSKTINNCKPDIIFHLAAQPLVRTSYNDPVYTYETNVMGTVNLLESVRDSSSVRVVINITTDKCYKNKEAFWGYREYDRLGGYEPYSSSKACSELITESYRNSFFNLKEYNKHGVAIATARAGNVIGGGDFAKDRLIPDCIRSIINNEKILIRSPKAVRPWQHVLEPLRGYIMLAEKLYKEGEKYSGAWNFGPNEDNEKNVEYIVNRICSLWKGNSTYKIDKNNHPHETTYLKLDSYKARNLLNFRPKLNIDKTLEQVVKWTREYISNKENLYNFTIAQIDEYESLS